VVLDTLHSLQGTPPADGVKLVQRLFDFCAHELEPGDEHAPRDVVTCLRRRIASPLGQAAPLSRSAARPACRPGS